MELESRATWVDRPLDDGCDMVRVAAPGGGDGPTRRAVPRTLVAALLLTGALSGCSDSGSGSTGNGSNSRDAALEVELAAGAEGLDTQARSEVQNDVGDVLSEYVVDGFLGDYPRENFVGSLEVFTAGAARGAARDIDLLTAARFASSDGVRATKLLAEVSCLTVGGEVAAATAHVDFGFEVADGDRPPQRVSLRGRFMLTRVDDTWSIFGYDVVRDDAERVTS